MAGFVDESQVHLKAGDGGAGAVSFRREAHVAHGGPDGGDGGNGGDIFLEASSSMSSLLAFRDHPHRRAEDGGHGGGGKRHGRKGQDLVVLVPEGTLVRSLEGAILADLAEAGDRLLAAEAGRGGRGNARFSSNKLRAPAFAEQGEVGEERWLNLELKLAADVALVGFPNVGKSTLISRISAASRRSRTIPSPRSSHISGWFVWGAMTKATSSSPTSLVWSKGPARAAGWAFSSSATSSGPGRCS